MSELKISPDLFLGAQELNKFQDFLGEQGYVRNLLNDSLSFGLIHKDIIDGDWSNFKVELGSNAGTLKINEGTAVDKNGSILKWALKDNIAITNDNIWKWIKIKHTYSPVEPYLVNISADGVLSAPGGSLLSILRGLPNNPSTIFFTNAVSNTQEYQVVEVIDDENAVLAGDFSAESNLQLSVVGSFTPDTVTPEDSKFPFQYDSTTVTLVNEVTLNTPPSLTADEEFIIARVRRNGVAIEIQDKRSVNIWRSKTDFDINTLSASTNPLIGVEAIKYNNNLSTRDENLAFVAWGFRSSNWTYDSTANRVTLIGGQGGLYKSTANFVNGDFDGWRLYTKDGSYAIIKQSSVSALQINLILDTLDPDKFTDAAQQLTVVPNAEAIELIFESVGTNKLGDKRVAFPINNGVVSVPLLVHATPTAQYTVKYRYASFKQFSQETVIPNDATGYYGESQFDINGVLTGSTRVPYTTGVITLTLATNAYSNVISTLSTGQSFGYQYLPLDNGDPVRNIVLGTDKENIIVTQELGDELNQDSDADFDEAGVPFVLSVNHYLSFDGNDSSLKNGNSFLLQFRGTYTLNGFTLNLVQNYVNPGNPGTLLTTITASELVQAQLGNLFYKIFWDGTQWQVIRFISAIPQFITKVIEIGDWNMDTTSVVSIAHNLSGDIGFTTIQQIRQIQVLIRSDTGLILPLDSASVSDGPNGAINAIGTSSVDLIRYPAPAEFDSTTYNQTSFNRGWITITYAI